LINCSIIIPTYNQVFAFLSAALHSAFQCYPREIIVIDDGSDDQENVQNLCHSVVGYYGKRLPGAELPMITYSYQENGGVASALNHGLRMADGEYIAWLPSDDLYRSDRLSWGISHMKQEGAKIQYSTYIEGIPHIIHTWPAAQYPTQEALFEALKKHSFINAATLIWHRDIFDQLGVFNEDIVHCQDTEMVLRCAEKYNFQAFHEPVVRRRIHERQMVNTLNEEEELKKKEADIQHLKDRYGFKGGVWTPST